MKLPKEYLTINVNKRNELIRETKRLMPFVCPDLAKIIASIFSKFYDYGEDGQKVINDEAEMTVSDIAAKAGVPYQKVTKSLPLIKEMGFFQFTKVRGGLLVEFNLPRYLEVLALVKRAHKEKRIEISQLPDALIIGESYKKCYQKALKLAGLQAFDFDTEGFVYVKRVINRKPKTKKDDPTD